MPRYFLHLRAGNYVALDEEGTEHEDMKALRAAVLASARDIMAGDVITKGLIDFRFRIDAEDAQGEIVYTLPFVGAVSIIPE
jgi:hypothetical protein